jgi:nitroimidazol reductase NimA-like FMN-containing flavoprotein (pyridoxamine 5'-phosphate oxidase superfamily)
MYRIVSQTKVLIYLQHGIATYFVLEEQEMLNDIPMRRKDRQVRGHDEIIKILEHIQVVNIGINDMDYPYVVPMSFGYEASENVLYIFLHSAKEGHKVALWSKNAKVTVEFNAYRNTGREGTKDSYSYGSVIGNGIIRKINMQEEIDLCNKAALAILKQSGQPHNDKVDVSHLPINMYVITCKCIPGDQ